MRTGPVSSIVAFIVAIGVSLSVLGGDKAKKTVSSDPPSAPAAIRLWKDLFPSQRGIRVQIRPTSRKAQATDIRIAANGYRFMDYFEIPAGDFTVEITDADNPKSVLLEKTISLLPQSFATLLLREDSNAVSGELVDDTIPDSLKDIGELTIRNLAPTLTNLQVQVGDELNAKLQSPASLLKARGLKRVLFEIELLGTDSSGASLRWTSEVDFRTIRKATLLIHPDPYGRIRPTVTVDGEMTGVPQDKE